MATSTHDTKRSEDVRARLFLLSEIPEKFGEAVHRWSAHNERYHQNGMPDRNAEYLLYQTLIGAWPLSAERALAYMEKAAREAKEHTAWTPPTASPAYEEALLGFVSGVLGDREFLGDLERFVGPLIEAGRLNSLSQTLLKLTSPGVADIYQGTELWDLSLVDPDNRRPVDFALRRRLLSELRDLSPEAILERMEEGLPKLYLIWRALQLRRRRPELFGPGASYQPLYARGRKAQHLVAFLRGEGAVTLVPRLVMRLGGDFGDTSITLPAGRGRNELTGERVEGGEQRVASLLGRFPVALLGREP